MSRDPKNGSQVCSDMIMKEKTMLNAANHIIINGAFIQFSAFCIGNYLQYGLIY